MDEQWRSVVGWEGLYEVSDQGRVRSTDRTITRIDGKVKRFRSRTLKHRLGAGRPRVTLSRNSAPTHALVAELVAAAFIGPRPEGALILHWDDNPSNNTASNLRYGTYSDNAADCVRNGHNPRKNRRACPRGHDLVPPNLPRWKAERGQRQCRACSLATSYIQRHGEVETKLVLADRYFAEIMSGTRP